MAQKKKMCHVDVELTPKERTDLRKCMKKKGIASESAFLRRSFKQTKRIMERQAQGQELVFRDMETGKIVEAKLIF